MNPLQIVYGLGLWAAFSLTLECCLWTAPRFGVFDLVAIAVTAWVLVDLKKERVLDLWGRLSIAALAAVFVKHSIGWLPEDFPLTTPLSIVAGLYIGYHVFMFLKNKGAKEESKPPKIPDTEKYPILFDDKGCHYLSTEAMKEPNQVIGATGSGKSVFMRRAIEQAIRRGAGAFVLDPKSDYRRYLAYYAQAAGRRTALKYFDVADIARSMTFNPLHGQDKDQVFNKTFRIMYPNQKEENEFYLGIGRSVIERIIPLLLKEVPSIIYNDLDQIFVQEATSLKTLKYLCRRHADLPESRYFEENWISKSPDQRQKDWAGLATKISRFVGKKWSPLINVRHPQVTIPEVMRNNDIFLFATSSLTNLEDSRPLIISVFMDMMQEIGKRFENPPEIPFFAFLDEFYNAAYPDFIELINKGRQANVPFFMAHQSLGDLAAVSENFKTLFLDNTPNKIIFRLADSDSGDHFAKLLGTETTMQSVFSYNTQTNASSGRTERPDEHFKFTPNLMKERDRGDAIVWSRYNGKVMSYRCKVDPDHPVSPKFDFAEVLPVRDNHKKQIDLLLTDEKGPLTQGDDEDEDNGGNVSSKRPKEPNPSGSGPKWHVPYTRRKDAIKNLPAEDRELLRRIREKKEDIKKAAENAGPNKPSEEKA